MQKAADLYTALIDRLQEVRRIQHDMRHHLRVLDGYAQNGEYDKLKEYLSALLEQMPPKSCDVYCMNYTANILIGYYAQEAKKEDITFHCDVQIPRNSSCSPQHLSILLGNSLENALEACRRQNEDEERRISLFARVIDSNLVLVVENTYDGIVCKKDGVICSRKEDEGHGLGMDSMENTVDLYGGYFGIVQKDELFLVKIVIPIEV